jgi:hypothetical protein
MRILPRELLERATSAEIGEIFAYYSLANEERETERSEQSLRKLFTRPKQQ